MPQPSVIAFDLGKVLVDFDYSRAAKAIAARGTMPAAQVQEFIDHSPLLFRYETGKMSRADFFAEVQRATGYAGNAEDFAAIFADIFSPMTPMIELHAELRQRGLPTYIFSNTNDMAIGHIRREFPFFADFDGYILSYEVGAMKPQPKIYEALEAMCGRRGAEILYIDDRRDNVDAGASRGWQTVFHRTAEETIARVRELGLA